MRLHPVGRRRIYSLAIVVMLISTTAFALTASVLSFRVDEAVPTEHGDETHTPARMLAWTAHVPILIEGNADFTSANGVTGGSGTESGPSVIDGWEISSFPLNGIEIRNADAYFTVSDCYVHHGGDMTSIGIYLYSCSNGTIGDCNSSSNGYTGIYLGVGSSNNTIVNNTCWSNAYGIILSGSFDITLANNTCLNNTEIGLALSGSYDNTLIGNNCTGNADSGIDIWNSQNNVLSGNNCSSNGLWGVLLTYSNNNTVSDSNISLSNSYGISISAEANGNLIWNNTFYHNNGAGGTFDPEHAQAFDDGMINWWNSTDGYGNRWYDWRGPDISPIDGIVDSPYDINGSVGSLDLYPIAEYQGTPVPEFGSMPLALVAILTIALFASLQRRGTGR